MFCVIHVLAITYKLPLHFIDCIICFKNSLKRFAIWDAYISEARSINSVAVVCRTPDTIHSVFLRLR